MNISGSSNFNQSPLFYDAYGKDQLIGTIDDDLRIQRVFASAPDYEK